MPQSCIALYITLLKSFSLSSAHFQLTVSTYYCKSCGAQRGQRNKSSGRAVLRTLEGVGGLELVAREDLVAMATNEPCGDVGGVMHVVPHLQ